MRDFTEKEKTYIVQNEDSLTLLQFAKKFDCKPNEVYECYSDIVESGEHWKYYQEKYEAYAKHISARRIARWGNDE